MTLISNAVLCLKWSFGAISHYSQDCLNEAAIFSMKEVMSTCFPGGSGSKEFACSEGGPGLIPGSGRSPGEGNGHPLQCSCLEDSMDREATVYGVAKSRTRPRK